MQDVSSRLAKLEPYMSQGPDELHPHVLRELSNTTIGKPLCLIYSRSVKESVVPEDWRRAEVIPIHKNGLRNVRATTEQ